MYTINNNNLITGYIKQLLHEFNLPKAKVLQRGMNIYADEYYIYQNNLYRAKKSGKFGFDGDFNSLEDSAEYLHKIDNYIYGKPYLNITKNLELKTPLYDSYTHNYLGEYLRFYRDYTGVDLMSMYNCFANEIAYSIKLNVRDGLASFKSDDSTHIIYIVPVKFYKKYTIALDCETAVEFAACFYNSRKLTKMMNDDEDINQILSEHSYAKKSGMSFSTPYLYDKLADILDDFVYREECYAHEKDLKLMIKVPIECKSSIVVLEGDYTSANEAVFDTAFSWEDNETGLAVGNWYTFDGVDYTKVIDENTEYYDGNVSVHFLEQGKTYHIGSADSEDTITIGDGPYYSFDNTKLKINRFTNNTQKDVKYFASFDNFPKKPSVNVIYVASDTGLSYLWKDEEFVCITDESITSLPVYSKEYGSRMQLLYVNDGVDYLFADKLIGYLIGNVITGNDNIWDNIRRTQKTYFYRRNPTRKPDYDANVDGKLPVGYEYMPKHVGVWSDELREMTYNLMQITGVADTAFDVIGYIDKDAEKVLGDEIGYDKTGHIISGGIR